MNKKSLEKNGFKEVKNKILQIIKNNYKSIILVSILTILSAGMIVIRMHELSMSVFSKRAMLIWGVIILLTLIICGVLYFAKKKKWKIERIFLVCGLIIGAFYCVCLPIGSAPDEPVHFFRAYEISEGYIVHQSDGTEMPKNITEIITNSYTYENNAYGDEMDKLFIQGDSELKKLGSPDYAVFNYIPQALGIIVGKILHLPLIPMMILSRLFNMVFCVVMIFLCIKYIPALKKVIFLVALFPMTMQLFASVSADGSIICAGIGLISYVLYARKGMKRKLNFWDFALLLLICLALVMTKPVYAFLCPIVLWIPKERFKSVKQKMIFVFLLGFLTVATMMVLRMLTSFTMGNRFGSVDTQKNFILQEPITFIELIFRNMVFSFDNYISQMMGRSLEWFTVDVYTPYIVALFVLFVLLCAEKESTVKLNLRVFSIVVFMLIFGAVITSMFVVWSLPGSKDIEGVQGRYLLPAIMLIPLFCLPSSKKNQKMELVKPGNLYIMTFLINVYVIATIMTSHIGH